MLGGFSPELFCFPVPRNPQFVLVHHIGTLGFPPWNLPERALPSANGIIQNHNRLPLPLQITPKARLGTIATGSQLGAAWVLSAGHTVPPPPPCLKVAALPICELLFWISRE